MIKWAGWLIVLFPGIGHTVGALVETAPDHAGAWFDGEGWKADATAMNYAEAALWYTVFSFGVPFLVIGLLVLWLDRRGITPPAFVAWIVAGWTLVTVAAGAHRRCWSCWSPPVYYWSVPAAPAVSRRRVSSPPLDIMSIIGAGTELLEGVESGCASACSHLVSPHRAVRDASATLAPAGSCAVYGTSKRCPLGRTLHGRKFSGDRRFLSESLVFGQDSSSIHFPAWWLQDTRATFKTSP
ncbi:hypothetical protein SAMN04244553_1327 [Nocardia amikacinitolerans]|uniref:Uncharacterized protein n=1 Tax=Nocardia amikacinitolerans TaxID=756689 RepID=A0A285L105_9NOCA|nr:DUF6463 family protein [Nocardia amikacinitolerans]SNY78565.1 hypothetical protein SAMN04244553_1327 [Nocardia amikacinitolerans]